jgi:predicted dehydrogenase
MEGIQGRIKGIIIGCGKIAGYFDNGQIQQPSKVYSYAEAMHLSRFLAIDACVDLVEEKAKKIADRYKIPHCYTNYNKALKALKPKFIIVATPDQTHFQITKEILLSADCPQLIIVEKPLCLSLAELEELKRLSCHKATQLIVNQSRRFNARFRALKQQLATNVYGPPFRLDFYTYGDWKKNGIHIIDTLMYLFDTSIKTEEILIEAYETNLKKVNWKDVVLRCSDAFIVTINHVPEQFYQLFEMDLKFEKARIHFQDFEQRLNIEKKTINKLNENILELSSANLATQENSNMFGLMQEVELFFQNKTTLADYSINAIEKSMKLYFKIIPYYEN